MRHSVFAGGKRVRPVLLIVVGELHGAPLSRLLPAAAALEMVHTFSLIHDDLPGIDDDDLRRGQPTLHKRYDEATAILAGDALLNLGVTLLTSNPADATPVKRLTAIEWLGDAIGTHGMIGGQMEDIESERRTPNDASQVLERIHRRKTGALFRVALRLGGLFANVDRDSDRLLSAIGDGIGLLFQIADDILDIEGDTETLGKTAGKDEQAEKLTYPRVWGLERSRELLITTRNSTLEAVSRLPRQGGALAGLVTYLAARDR